MNLSVPLIAEYEAVAKRLPDRLSLEEQDLEDILDYICLISNRQKIFFLWRPFLKDAEDDMVLELAVASKSQFIVTFNEKHFTGCEQFDVKVVTPKEFLKIIGKSP